MNTLSKALVIGEAAHSYGALCALARTIAEDVDAVCVGAANADEIAQCGASSSVLVEQEENACIEAAIPIVVDRVKQAGSNVVLLANSRRMRLVAASIAAAFGTSVLNDAMSLAVDDDGCVVIEKLVHGGSAVCTQRAVCGPAVVLVSEGLLSSVEAAEAVSGQVEPGRVESVAGPSAPSGVSLVRREERPVESVNLAAAKCVCSIGRGVSAESDLELISKLALCLEAEIGCTRPIAEGNGWLARERYIGVSGAMIRPDVFVAIGLSGQVQHMVGAERARSIFVINKDKNAPIFKYADYGIVGDLYDVIPKLLEALQ